MSWVDTDPKYAFLGGKDRWENSSSVNSGPQGASQASELNLPNTMPPGLSYVTWQMMTRKSTLQDAFPPDESMLEEQNIIAEVDTVYMSVME